MTKEGIAGTVVEVQDGPHAGNEQYLVELDGGLGGGEYGPGELRALEGATASKTAATVRWTHQPDDQRFADSWDGDPGPTPDELDAFVFLDEEGGPWQWEVHGRTRWLSGEAESADEAKAQAEAAVDQILGGGGYTGAKTAACTDECNEMHTFEDECEQAVENLHTADLDYPELGDILIERPPLEHAVPVDISQKRMSKAAGIFDKAIDSYTGWVNNRLPPDKQYVPGAAASYDWCRFRKNSRCMYPKELNVEATKQAGYAVWVPVDRGRCPRIQWDEQRDCPVSEPGPYSGDPQAGTDATVPWEQGGQRGGVPGPEYVRGSLQTTAYVWKDTRQSLTFEDKVDMALKQGLIDQQYHDLLLGPYTDKDTKAKFYNKVDVTRMLYDAWGRDELAVDSRAEMEEQQRRLDQRGTGADPGAPPASMADYADVIRARMPVAAAFEFTAKWSDVQEKAKRIRTDGGVRIVVASPQYLVGEIRGDTNLYETSIEYVPGTKQAALWTCGCAWANYSWGRSGRWKKFEGRMCSHGLALMYEAQARGMFGREVTEDATVLRRDPTVPVVRPGDYRTKPAPWRTGRRIETDPILQHAPVTLIAEGMLSEGSDPNHVLDYITSTGAKSPERIISEAMSMSFRDLNAKVRGLIRKVHEVYDDTREALVEGMGLIRADEILYPTWDPRAGLDFVSRAEASLQSTAAQFPNNPQPGERVWVYRNLQTGTLSVLRKGPSGWRVDENFYTPHIHLRNVEFRTRQGGWERVQDEGVKNVHSFVIGDYVDANPPPPASQLPAGVGRARYSPKERNEYFDLDTDAGLSTAPEAWVTSDTNGWRDAESGKSFFPYRTASKTSSWVACENCGSDNIEVYGDEIHCMDCGHNEIKAEATKTATPAEAADWDWEPEERDLDPLVAELKDEPEPALPEATAEEPDEVERDDDWPLDARDELLEEISGEDATIRHRSDIGVSDTTAARAWLLKDSPKSGGGPSDSDIAKNAQRFLKEGMKAFSPAEQAELINEGEGVTASNLDRLDIAGTHYVELEAALAAEDEEDLLWG